MRNRISPAGRVGLWLLGLFLLPLCAGNALADGGANAADFAGTFSSAQLTVQFSASNGGYAGTITLNGTSFPAKATASGNNLSGTFTASGHDFPFTAALQNDQLTFSSGDRSYTLNRAVVNPLAAPQGPANPLAQAPSQPASPAPSQPPAAAGQDQAAADPASLQKLGDFTILGATDSGKTLFIDLPSAQSLETSITQSADEIGKVLDAKPAISGAFASAKNHNKGGATFTDKLKGQDVRGVIFCGAAPKGYTAAVVIIAAGAPKDQIAALLGFLPVQMKMHTHAFPDNSGSVDLPDGWTTADTTATYGFAVRGPAGQVVVVSFSRIIYYPNCLQVRQSRQVYQMQMNNYQFAMNRYQQMLRLHQNLPNTPMPVEPVKPTPPNDDPNVQFKPMIFCRYCDGPEDVLKYIYPLGERRAKASGNGYTTVDKVLGVVQCEGNPYVAGSKGGIVYLAVTDHAPDGKETKVRVINRMTTTPCMPGELWQLVFTIVRAPDATFDRDLPVMTAILNSVNLNMDVVNKKIADDGAKVRAVGAEQFRQLMQRGREFQQQQDEHFQRFEAQMAAQQQARHDSASDFIEYIRGARDIYDSQTGQMYQGDLFNINGIVDGLNANANDSNRFVQIPLRYER